MRKTVNPDLFAFLVIATAAVAGFHAFLLLEYSPPGFAEVHGVEASDNILELRTSCHVLEMAVSSEQVEAIRSAGTDGEDIDAEVSSHKMMEGLMSPLTAVERVEVTGIEGSRYRADTVVRDAGVFERTVDSRPSDATALALGTGSDILVNEGLLRSQGQFTCDGTV